MFVQVGDHRGHAQGGLGIGLSLVRTLVEMHGGSISARSEGPGRGSEFVVRLPGPRASPRRRPRPAAGRSPGAGRQAAAGVGSWSWTTTWTPPGAWPGCWSGSTGRRSGSPTTAPRPWPSPGSSGPRSSCSTSACPGWTATRWPGGSGSGPSSAATLIVALTGWGQESDVERSQEAGFDHHLVKPANPEAILELLLKAGDARRVGPVKG